MAATKAGCNPPMLPRVIGVIVGTTTAGVTSDALIVRTWGAIRFLTSAKTTDGTDEHTIKVVTGQSTVIVRHIYGRPFTYSLEYTLCFSSNYEPVIKG